MTVNHNEILSALVDGELTGNELDQALHLLSTNEQARLQMQRYQFVSDVMNGYATNNLNIDLTKKVSMALTDEPVFSQTSTTKPKAMIIPLPKRFWQQAAGLAVAASVGALAVVGVMTQPQNPTVPMMPLASIDTPAQVVVVETHTGNRWTVGEPEVADRLNTYLVDHNEYAGASGVFSYARVVSYEVGQ